MKNILFFILLTLSFSFYSQNISDTVVKTRIILYNGNEFIGQIISKDSRDILVLTEERGPIYIPQYEIKNMIAVRQEEYNQNGEFIGEDIFATRYFISTNGLPIKKGEHYVQWPCRSLQMRSTLLNPEQNGILRSVLLPEQVLGALRISDWPFLLQLLAMAIGNRILHYLLVMAPFG
jgi:hypothetical protein